MFKRIMVLLLLVLILPVGGSFGSQGSTLTELAAVGGGKFDAPLELIAGLAVSESSWRLAARTNSPWPELSRLFHLDTGEAEPIANLLVQVKEGDFSELESAGFAILGRFEDVAAIAVPISQLAQLRDASSIIKAEVSRAMTPEIDISMAITRANLVRTHLGNGVFTGQTGANCLIAIMDSGIDIFHQDFRKPDGTTRIKALWDVADQSYRTSGGVIGSNPPMKTASGQPLGTAYTEAQINACLRGAGIVNSRSLDGHGHHVAGIAAGNGRATGGSRAAGQYIGMAPEAGLIIVQVNSNDAASNSVTYDDRVLTAMGFIEQQASALGLPVVVNLSAGTHVGAHDGTSLLESKIDTFSGPGKRGRLVVKSAGNDGGLDIHAGGLFGPLGAINNQIVVQVEKGASDPVFFDFWFSGKDTFNVTLEGGGSGSSVLTGLVRNDPANGDKELFFSTTRTGTLFIKIEGLEVNSGRFDAWITSRNAQFTRFAERLQHVTIPGTARNVITVGSFNSKNSWVDADGNSHTMPSIEEGALSSFSSNGPTRDGRIKPDLTAPGQRIASSLAATFAGGISIVNSIFSPQDIVQDTVHALSQGTSFAAPHVAGLAALMLSKNPNLDALQIRELMTQNTLRDGFTGMRAESIGKREILPDVNWGYGKLDAQATLDATPIVLPTQFLAFIDSPTANASIAQSFTVVGWALASQGLSQVELLVDGRVHSLATTGIPRPDVCSVFPTFGPNCPFVGFTAQVQGLDFGSHTIALRLTDSLGTRSNGGVAPRAIRIEPFPIRALIDSPKAGATVSPNFEIYGWAVSNAGIQSVEVLLDEVFVKNASLRQLRPDVCAAFPGADPACPEVGYRALLEELATGSHQLTVRITDKNGAVRSLAAGIQVAPPRITAFIETPASGALVGSSMDIAGWAISPFGISAVELYVDGTLSSLASLNVPRPDVCSAFTWQDPACPNVGFTGTVSDISLGAHRLTFLIRDAQGEIAYRSLDFQVVTRGYIEIPLPGTTLSNPFEVLGWAISPSGVTNVTVLLDGIAAASATLGQSRPDVCTVFPGADPACPNVGFRAVLSALPGMHSLSVVVTNGRGQPVNLPMPPLAISVVVPPPSGIIENKKHE